MTWFQDLTGLREVDGAQVRANLSVSGSQMVSRGNGRQMQCGILKMPSLEELRQSASVNEDGARIALAEVIDDVQHLHCDDDNGNAVFQVASQFNLLEMMAPSVTPEDGIEIYERDRTQGPACAIACGAGTIYRNYFVPVDGQIGQTAARQIDCLADLGSALGNGSSEYWQMRNGYALPNREGLKHISAHLQSIDEHQRDALRQKLRIGIHEDTEVTLSSTAHCVTQVYCSALPVSYTSLEDDLWEPLARLVLEAAYEATFYAALANWRRTGCQKLYLTLLGGGAFGNQPNWILDALRRALDLFSRTPLQVGIVSYRSSKPPVRDFVRNWTAS